MQLGVQVRSDGCMLGIKHEKQTKIAIRGRAQTPRQHATKIGPSLHYINADVPT
jgi:hypothetical protein